MRLVSNNALVCEYIPSRRLSAGWVPAMIPEPHIKIGWEA